MYDNAETDVLLYGDSRLDRNRNKVALETTLTDMKNSEILQRFPKQLRLRLRLMSKEYVLHVSNHLFFFNH